MKRGKSAQVSTFVIISVILVAGIIAIFFTYNSPKPVISKDPEQVKNFLSDCFSSTYKDSLDKVGIQGGYFNEPLSEYFDTGYYNIPFYYFGGITYIPSREFIEEELSSSVNAGVFQCLSRLQEFNIDFDYDYNFTNVTINEKEVSFVPDLELILTKGGQTFKYDFKEHPIEISSNLMEMNDLASYIIYSYKINSGSVCVNCILSVASDKGFNVEIYNDFKNILIVNIFDNSSQNHPSDYSFFIAGTTEELNVPIIPRNISNSSKINPINMSDGKLNVSLPILKNE